MQAHADKAIATNSGRINYIDALRGLSMILVVLAHVYLFMSPRHWDGSPLASILMSFRMPLFFFVSGFFAYKTINRWTRTVVTDILVRKVRAQVLCATIFYMLYQYIHHAGLFDFVTHGYGYFWFTIALFQMFVLYVALNLVSRLIGRNIVDASLVVLSVASCVAGLTVFKDGIGVTLSWHQIILYFQYFAGGILVRRHWGRFERMLSSDAFRTITIVLFAAGCFTHYGDWYRAPSDLPHYLTQGVLHRWTGLFTVLIFFHSRADLFNGGGTVARFLRFTGTRTLDIYMMHMFFVPYLANTGLYAFLSPPGMAAVKLALGLTIALTIVGVCLLLSSVLRTSRFLSVWLFGVRRRPRPAQPRPESTQN